MTERLPSKRGSTSGRGKAPRDPAELKRHLDRSMTERPDQPAPTPSECPEGVAGCGGDCQAPSTEGKECGKCGRVGDDRENCRENPCEGWKIDPPEPERVTERGGWDDLRRVLHDACLAISKGDAPEAIEAYLWSCISPRLTDAEARVREAEGLVWKMGEQIKRAEAQRDEARAELEGLREALREIVALDRPYEAPHPEPQLLESEQRWHDSLNIAQHALSDSSSGESG